jgi:hypothetical protein
MRRNWVMIYLLCGALVVSVAAYAQQNPIPICSTTSVTSASVPVQVSATHLQTTWTIKERHGGAENILVFPILNGAVPTSAPSACASPATTFTAGTGCIELVPDASFSDSVGCDNPSCNNASAVGAGWAAVLETGSTAVTVDSCYR